LTELESILGGTSAIGGGAVLIAYRLFNRWEQERKEKCNLEIEKAKLEVENLHLNARIREQKIE